jgi:hypothetical protein
MRSLRRFIRTRSSGGLVAVCVAYSLAIQALMMSVGLGMSAAAAPGDFFICGLAAGPGVHAPVPRGDRQNPAPRPECPFCFVAAQSAGHIATMHDGPAVPSYVGIPIPAGLLDHFATGLFIPQFRRMVGDPRAPPSVSV